MHITNLRHISTQQFAQAMQDFRGTIIYDSALKKDYKNILSISKKAIQLPSGEKAKNWRCLEEVLLALSRQNHERTQPILVVGGGAACDLGALAASLYRRGVPLILVPTTLLAMVDASIGGKTAIDWIPSPQSKFKSPMIKNFAGTFYPASEIWLCAEFLETLPKQERLSGTAELLKMLWLDGKAFDKKSFDELLLWSHGGRISKSVWRMIQQSIRYKEKIISQDFYDQKRIREVLNFGHTVGHALESHFDGKVTHGAAVAWGMWIETLLVNPDFALELQAALECIGFSWQPVKNLTAQKLEKIFLGDKKMKNQELEMSVLKSLGKPMRMRIAAKDLAVFVVKVLRAQGRLLK